MGWITKKKYAWMKKGGVPLGDFLFNRMTAFYSYYDGRRLTLYRAGAGWGCYLGSYVTPAPSLRRKTEYKHVEARNYAEALMIFKLTR